MNDTGEMWSSPWRRMHKNLANRSRTGLPGEYLASRRAGQLAGTVVPTTSWLVRARSRKQPARTR